MKKNIYHYFTGVDFFISYSRIDGSLYTLQLADMLTKKGFSCYIDQWGSQPGKELPLSLLKIIRNASVLVVVGSNGACESENVGKEIDEFKKGNGIILPIDFGKLEHAVWFSSIEGIQFSKENLEHLTEVKISQAIETRILNAIHFKKQSQRISQSLKIGVSVLSIMLIAAVFLAYKNTKASQQLKQNTHLISKQDATIQRTSLQLKKVKDSSKLIIKEKEALTRERDKLTTSISTAKKENALLGKQIKSATEKVASLDQMYTKQFTSAQAMSNEFDRVTSAFPGFMSYCASPVFEVKKGELILFPKLDTSGISPSHQKILQTFITDWKKSVNQPNIVIEGYYMAYYIDDLSLDIIQYTDGGKLAYNLKLSERLASNFTRYLVQNGIPQNKITAKGKGGNPKTTPGIIFNNRVEISTE